MKYFASMMLLVLGRYYRNKGCYNNNTLKFFYCAYKLNTNISVLLAYVRFRRDLGYPLCRRLAAQLLFDFNKLANRKRRQAANLLIESGFRTQLTSQVDVATLLPFSLQSPPIAALMSNQNLAVQYSQALSTLYQKQSVWRGEFTDYLLRQNNSICVVGNAASIIGSKSGSKIDEYDVVFRFNHYASVISKTEDIGKKITVWCCAPDCTKLFSDKDANLDWSILSGPDVCYQMAEWQSVGQFLKKGGKVLTTPLRFWRDLVRLLHAPPSAGILLLYWIIDTRGSVEGLVVTGFDLDASTKQCHKQYHHALPRHKAARRHNWEGEREILRKWKSQGLIVLK